jgi:hypothetical protein
MNILAILCCVSFIVALGCSDRWWELKAGNIRWSLFYISNFIFSFSFLAICWQIFVR